MRHCFPIKIFSMVFLFETYFAAIGFIHTRTHTVPISIETNEWEWTVSHDMCTPRRWLLTRGFRVDWLVRFYVQCKCMFVCEFYV